MEKSDEEGRKRKTYKVSLHIASGCSFGLSSSIVKIQFEVYALSLLKSSLTEYDSVRFDDAEIEKLGFLKMGKEEGERGGKDYRSK